MPKIVLDISNIKRYIHIIVFNFNKFKFNIVIIGLIFYKLQFNNYNIWPIINEIELDISIYKPYIGNIK